MAAKRGLDKLTADFAGELSSLLNQTICDGIRLTPVTSHERGMSWVGYEIRRDSLSPARAIPIGVTGQPSAFIHAAFTLTFDDEGDYVQVQQSTMGICAEPDLDEFLFHYDYDRDKVGYPDAHVQIPVVHPAWETIRARIKSERTFGRLHLPLGPKRFRPTIEDLIEFVVDEGIATPRNGWREPLDTARQEFADKQLRAAVRRNIDVARAAVQEFS